MKKRLLTVAIVAAMIASLAGCSNGDNKTDAKADTTTETTADTGKENEKDKDYVIGCVLISGTIQHCQLFKQGFEETCAANGAEAVVLDANYDPQVLIATVYKGNIIKNLIMDCQSYTKYRPNETTGGIFVSWRRKEELPTGA